MQWTKFRDKILYGDQFYVNENHYFFNSNIQTNSIDDGGVMVGDWSGQYLLGTSPMAWISSVSILEEYWKTKQPVRYGQCWVFAAVVTTCKNRCSVNVDQISVKRTMTLISYIRSCIICLSGDCVKWRSFSVCRSLGIPCRPVTNYQSAHDTDGSITIDSHWNHKGEPLEKQNKDTIW